MKYLFSIVIFSIFLILVSPNNSFSKDEIKPEFKKYFDEYNVRGTFVLYDLKNKKYIKYNPKRAETQFTPASTFKILNSLIGLETGEISGENYVFKWDGKKRDIENWNQDLVLRNAFQYSCFPCYQSLARRVGKQKYKKWLDKTSYGNKNISEEVDRFWVDDSLQISPNQQVKLLQKLYEKKLPFSDENQELVKKIMLVEEKPNYKLYTKTGLGIVKNKKIGWYVGFIEQNENVYFFATNMETENDDGNFVKARIDVTKNILKALNLL